MKRVSGILFSFLGFVFFLSGCASLRPQVHYSVLLPSKIQLDQVNRIAILDFAVPLGDAAQGRWFARALYDLFEEQSDYRMIAPGTSHIIIKKMNIRLSRFRRLETVRRVGEALGAHALLFGDLTIPAMQTFHKKEKMMHQVGVRRELETVFDSLGNTRSFWREIPLFEEVTQHTRNRQLAVLAKARLIRIKDGVVLWEGQAEGQVDDEVVFMEGSLRVSQQRSEENLRFAALHQTVGELVQDLLPRRVIRYRQLACVKEKNAYADFVTQGNAAALKNDWMLAGRLWLEAVILDPQRPEAHANLGILREGAQEYAQALKDYRYAAEKLGAPWTIYLRELEKAVQ
ncbi:hypothetical protein K8S19_06685 [bacterium]|nr:hypothetical protein [bacterium]